MYTSPIEEAPPPDFDLGDDALALPRAERPTGDGESSEELYFAQEAKVSRGCCSIRSGTHNDWLFAVKVPNLPSPALAPASRFSAHNLPRRPRIVTEPSVRGAESPDERPEHAHNRPLGRVKSPAEIVLLVVPRPSGGSCGRRRA